jgi:hypothetical protein
MDTTITIHSKMAEMFGDPITEWTGPINVVSIDVNEQLEHIFRQFNRVDEADCDRLEALDYKLPSLSSGDIVTIGGKKYLCASFGWEEVGAT